MGQGHEAERGWSSDPGSSRDVWCRAEACGCSPHDKHPMSRDSTSRTGLDLVQRDREAMAWRGTATAGHSWDARCRGPGVQKQPLGWWGSHRPTQGAAGSVVGSCKC